MPADPVRRYETIQWLMVRMAGIGPIFGQLGFFYRGSRPAGVAAGAEHPDRNG